LVTLPSAPWAAPDADFAEGSISSLFGPNTFAIGNVLRRHHLELGQQRLRRSQIAAVIRQFEDNLPLSGNVILAFGYVPLSLREMAVQHRSVHAPL